MATGSQSFYKGSDEIPNHDCDCLSNHKTVEAISYCTTCCEYLCQPCELSHRGSRALRSHTILTGSDVPSGSTGTKLMLPFMFCDKHKTTLLNIYCTTHDVIICPTCKIASLKTCDKGDVSGHIARLDVESEIKKVSKRLRVLTTTYEDLTKNRHIDRSTVMIQLQKCLSDMRQFLKNINDKLDKEEKIISSEIRCIEETMTKEIDEHVILADDSLRHIGDLVKSLSECQKTRENDVMFVGLKKATCRANEYGYIHSNINKDIYPIDIRVQPNDVLADMIQHLQSVGTVYTNRPMYTGHGQTSILNMSVTDKQEIDVKSKRVTGCTFMSDGHLVLACQNGGLKLFDKNSSY